MTRGRRKFLGLISVIAAISRKFKELVARVRDIYIFFRACVIDRDEKIIAPLVTAGLIKLTFRCE